MGKWQEGLDSEKLLERYKAKQFIKIMMWYKICIDITIQ